MKINTIDISGPWDVGLTLDSHTVSSEFLVYDLAGRPQFETTRSELGETLYQARYGGARAAVGRLAEIAGDALRRRMIAVDVVVPVPPSKARSYQPLMAIAEAVAADLQLPYDGRSLRKVTNTPELKSMSDIGERKKALVDTFEITAERLAGKRVLLLDDLYRSGASMEAAARVVRNAGRASFIVALAFTRTRTRA